MILSIFQGKCSTLMNVSVKGAKLLVLADSGVLDPCHSWELHKTLPFNNLWLLGH
jgi:hypothetical protein